MITNLQLGLFIEIAGLLTALGVIWSMLQKAITPIRETRELAQKSHDIIVRHEETISALDTTVREELRFIKTQGLINSVIVDMLAIIARNIEFAEADKQPFTENCAQLKMYAEVAKAK